MCNVHITKDWYGTEYWAYLHFIGKDMITWFGITSLKTRPCDIQEFSVRTTFNKSKADWNDQQENYRMIEIITSSIPLFDLALVSNTAMLCSSENWKVILLFEHKKILQYIHFHLFNTNHLLNTNMQSFKIDSTIAAVDTRLL